ncbi:MAG: hypothetical protein Tsb0020_42390 [Haliangiales bacterium]
MSPISEILIYTVKVRHSQDRNADDLEVGTLGTARLKVRRRDIAAGDGGTIDVGMIVLSIASLMLSVTAYLLG